jgi:hypothetical protein
MQVKGWELKGICASGRYNTNLWFPESGFSPNPAIRLCEACPVLKQCQRDTLALDTMYGVSQIYGVRGGWSASQREFMKRGGVLPDEMRLESV